MRQRDPIVFTPCTDKNCHYYREYRMRFDQKGMPYGIGMDGPADPIQLCNLCKRHVKTDFYFNQAEWVKQLEEEEKAAQEAGK